MNWFSLIGLIACVVAASAFHAAVHTDSRTQYCIILDSKATGTVVYETTDNQTKTYNFKIPEAIDVGGKCLANVTNGTTVEKLSFGFYPNNVTLSVPAEPWKLTIVFKEKPEQADNAYVIADYYLYANFYPEIFENATFTDFTYTRDAAAQVDWQGEKNLGYTCSKSGLALSHESSIVFDHLKVVAFGIFDSANFTDTQGFNLCKLDMRTSDLIPIVVGACLAGLVVVVLIAYLIGRARAKRQGYASV